MAWTEEHKIQSRERIVDSAALLFTQYGFDSVSIDDVMKAAGLTRGAFYAHFKNKAELYQYAILAGARQAKALLEQAEEFTVSSIAEHYLRLGDASHPESFCPLAFFVTDMTQRDSKIRNTYTQALKGYIEILESMALSPDKARQAAVMMIGGLALSRAITDEVLREDLLQSCLAGVRVLVMQSTEADKAIIRERA